MKQVDFAMESNPGAEWKARRQKVLSCSWCPPNKRDNTNRNSMYDSKSWKKRSKRPRQFKRIKDLCEK